MVNYYPEISEKVYVLPFFKSFIEGFFIWIKNNNSSILIVDYWVEKGGLDIILNAKYLFVEGHWSIPFEFRIKLVRVRRIEDFFEMRIESFAFSGDMGERKKFLMENSLDFLLKDKKGTILFENLYGEAYRMLEKRIVNAFLLFRAS
jgi:hypothetical protein